MEEIITDAADELIFKYPSISSVEEAVEAAFNFSFENKKAILHICNSINRDMYERYLMRICEYVITTYFNMVFGEIDIKEENKDSIIIFLKCKLFGLSIDWINSGMPDNGIVKLKHILSLFSGTVIDTITPCQEN